MRLVTDQNPIVIEELRTLAATRFGDMVKGVADVARGILLIDADMHADQEALLLSEGSRQQDLWGFNLYPDIEGDEWIELDSMINLRPSLGNCSRGVDDPPTAASVVGLVRRLVRR